MVNFSYFSQILHQQAKQAHFLICSMFIFIVMLGRYNKHARRQNSNIFTNAWNKPAIILGLGQGQNLEKKCLNCEKGEFQAKLGKMYWTNSLSKIKLPHIYRNPKLQHNSLLRQSSVKFGTYFTQPRKKYTQALLARFYIFLFSALVTTQLQKCSVAQQCIMQCVQSRRVQCIVVQCSKICSGLDQTWFCTLTSIIQGDLL